MANGVLIVAETGFGKSTSLGQIPAGEDTGLQEEIIGLDPKETLLINIKDKPLPYRGWVKHYSRISDERPPLLDNYLASPDPNKIMKTMDYFDNNRPDIKNVVIDDFQYMMAEEFMTNALKAGYEKFSKLAKNAYDVLNRGLRMRNDINFIVLTHAEEAKDGWKMKTIGKMLDEKVTLPGLFTITLYGKESWDEKERKVSKKFVTNYDGEYPAKSPIGMFKELYIPNDLGFVVKTINEYYQGE